MFVFALSLFATTVPVTAAASNVEVVKACLSHVRASKRDKARACFSSEIVWQTQNVPAGESVVSGAYLVYLAVVSVKIGPIKSFECREVDTAEVACDIHLAPMYESRARQLTERYSVENGKIVKVASILPSEVREHTDR